MSISREQLFIASGVIKIVDSITDRAYKELEEKIWREDLENSPHGEPWHTSFHASSFPGDDQTACGRKEVYSLMNVPNPEPTKRFLRSVADSGKAIEKELVKRWGQYGRLLSADVGAQFQTGFVDAPLWLTGNTDAALLPYRWKRPHIIEVKSKAHDKVLAMKNNERGPDKKHRLQVMTYIGLAYELHPWQEIKIDPKTWKIDPNGETIRLGRCIDGTIYYVSRDDPSTTHEFTYTYDPEFMAQGRDKLSDWKKAFEEGTLPDRPRYSGNKLVGWSKDHCKFCPLKKNVCKPDWENGITELSKSHAIEFTKGIWPDYDYQATRDKVLSRWTSN